MYEIKLSERIDILRNNKEINWCQKDIKWYDLIECEYYSDTQSLTYVYLPAAFLKRIGILSSDVDLGDERQYKLDFHKFKKDGKNIDELFDAQKRPTYKEMLRYCRHLYRESTKRKNEYGKEQDQAEQQFIQDFRKFLKENGLKIDFGKCAVELKNAFKVFILLRSSKIEELDYPLDYNRDFLPDEAKILQLEKMLSFSKDTGTVGGFDGRYSSKNGIYIQKSYASIWVNLIAGEDEIRYLLEYITLFESAEISVPDRYKDFIEMDCALKRTKRNREYLPYVSSKVYQIICQRILTIKKIKGIGLYLEKKNSFSIYYILKMYINDKLKAFIWRNTECNEEDFNSGLLSIEDRKKIYKITEKKKIDEENGIAGLLRSSKHKAAFNEEEQDIIFNAIFPDDVRSLKEKRNQLINHLEEIYLLYNEFILKVASANQEINQNYVYHMIITAYIFFKINEMKITSLKYTEIGCTSKGNVNNRKRPARSNLIGAYLKHMAENEINKENFEENNFNRGYLEPAVLAFAKYGHLFKIQSNVSVKHVEEMTKYINVTIEKLWSDARELNQQLLY